MHFPDTHLRFRRAKNQADVLGQVATPHPLVARLLEDLPPDRQRIVDLGAGDGRLARAALAKCPAARALLVETDPARVQRLVETRSEQEVVHEMDVLRAPKLLQLRRTFGVADVFLSNPPYVERQVAPRDIQRLRDLAPGLPLGSSWARADIAFLLYGWALTALGSFIGLVLPAPALTHARYRPLRQMLVGELEGLTVSQLPSRAFAGVEVDAFLVTGTRARPARREVTLRVLDAAGEVLASRRVSPEAAVRRLDYAAQAIELQAGEEMPHTLASLGVEIVRGSQTNIAFRRASVDAVHTSHLAAEGIALALGAATGRAGHRLAEAGDILVSRVGSRCLSRGARVMVGACAFTDSVYRLRAAPAVQDRVWDTINSDFGRQWRTAHAVGSCAKHLPLEVLREMPIR